MIDREQVDIEEDDIRGIMAREATAYDGGSPPVEKTTAATPAPKADKPEEPKEVRRPPGKRRKKESEPEEDYAGRFLVNDRSKNRVSANISRELFDRIKQYLSLVAPDISLTSYLNNIISDHIDSHWDEISELITQKLKNIYNHGD
jgi:hypothetical protein